MTSAVDLMASAKNLTPVGNGNPLVVTVASAKNSAAAVGGALVVAVAAHANSQICEECSEDDEGEASCWWLDGPCMIES